MQLTRYSAVKSRTGHLKTFGHIDQLVNTLAHTSRDVLYGGFVASEGRRTYEHWQQQWACFADIDTPGGADRAPITDAEIASAADILRTTYPTLWYPSRRGIRLLYALRQPVRKLETAKAVCRGVWHLLERAFRAAGSPLQVDDCTTRPLQIQRAPGDAHIHVGGYIWDASQLLTQDQGTHTRQAATSQTSRTPRTTASGHATWPIPERRIRPHDIPIATTVVDACRNWELGQTFEFGPVGHWACPVCGSWTGFGTSQRADQDRWVCFSSRHPSIGRATSMCHIGDVPELVAWAHGLSVQDMLTQDRWMIPH